MYDEIDLSFSQFPRHWCFSISSFSKLGITSHYHFLEIVDFDFEVYHFSYDMFICTT